MDDLFEQLPEETRVRFQQENPKHRNTKAWMRYETYKVAETFGQAKDLRFSKDDFYNDHLRGYVEITTPEGRVVSPQQRPRRGPLAAGHSAAPQERAVAAPSAAASSPPSAPVAPSTLPAAPASLAAGSACASRAAPATGAASTGEAAAEGVARDAGEAETTPPRASDKREKATPDSGNPRLKSSPRLSEDIGDSHGLDFERSKMGLANYSEATDPSVKRSLNKVMTRGELQSRAAHFADQIPCEMPALDQQLQLAVQILLELPHKGIVAVVSPPMGNQASSSADSSAGHPSFSGGPVRGPSAGVVGMLGLHILVQSGDHGDGALILPTTPRQTVYHFRVFGDRTRQSRLERSAQSLSPGACYHAAESTGAPYSPECSSASSTAYAEGGFAAPMISSEYQFKENSDVAAFTTHVRSRFGAALERVAEANHWLSRFQEEEDRHRPQENPPSRSTMLAADVVEEVDMYPGNGFDPHSNREAAETFANLYSFKSASVFPGLDSLVAGLGLAHIGIETAGSEYTYLGGQPLQRGPRSIAVRVGPGQRGVVQHPPGHVASAKLQLYTKIRIGGGRARQEVGHTLRMMLATDSTWDSSAYQVPGHCCQDFARAMARELGLDELPYWCTMANDVGRDVLSAFREPQNQPPRSRWSFTFSGISDFV